MLAGSCCRSYCPEGVAACTQRWAGYLTDAGTCCKALADFVARFDFHIAFRIVLISFAICLGSGFLNRIDQLNSNPCNLRSSQSQSMSRTNLDSSLIGLMNRGQSHAASPCLVAHVPGPTYGWRSAHDTVKSIDLRHMWVGVAVWTGDISRVRGEAACLCGETSEDKALHCLLLYPCSSAI